jgi:nitrite reductase/ring-hydroxylating ferredoxin subunit
MRSSEALNLPAVKRVRKHEVKVEDGDVYVALDSK